MTTFENEELGIRAELTEGDKGFHVGLRDTDSDETLGVVRCFPKREDAVEYAESLVKG